MIDNEVEYCDKCNAEKIKFVVYYNQQYLCPICEQKAIKDIAQTILKKNLEGK